DLKKGEIKQRLIGHALPVADAKFSPDDRFVLTAAFDNEVRLWEAKTGKVVHVMAKHRAPARSVAFFPSGKFAASCGEDGVV
ncbi:MAG: hypothetical protein QF805_14070, partial [Pirellulaceae bacterium]|nr:hypothetical protein [Pirellulaceae bacterium]